MRFHKFVTNKFSDGREEYTRIDLDKIFRIDEAAHPSWSRVCARGREWEIEVRMAPEAVAALVAGEKIPPRKKPTRKREAREIEILIARALRQELIDLGYYMRDDMHGAARKLNSYITQRCEVLSSEIAPHMTNPRDAKASEIVLVDIQARLGELLRLKNAATVELGGAGEWLSAYIVRRKAELEGAV